MRGNETRSASEAAAGIATESTIGGSRGRTTTMVLALMVAAEFAVIAGLIVGILTAASGTAVVTAIIAGGGAFATALMLALAVMGLVMRH